MFHRRVARARGHRTNTNAVLAKAADDPQMPFHGLRWRSLAALETPGALLLFSWGGGCPMDS